VNGSLIALCDGSLLSLNGRDERIARALTCVERALAGRFSSGSRDRRMGVGIADHCTSLLFDGPRGGRAVVIRAMGLEDQRFHPDEMLATAHRALLEMIAPTWSMADKTHAHQVALACALAAHENAPGDMMWAGFIPGPTGTVRADRMPDRGGRVVAPGTNPWRAGDLDDVTPTECLPSVTIGIDNPSDHGRVPMAITLRQTYRTLHPQGLERLDAVTRLRLHALIPRADGA
jgi:hypothetical protein